MQTTFEIRYDIHNQFDLIKSDFKFVNQDNNLDDKELPTVMGFLNLHTEFFFFSIIKRGRMPRLLTKFADKTQTNISS